MQVFSSPFAPLGSSERQASLAETLDDREETDGLWLFAYGSLMWNFGVAHSVIRPARLLNWQRQFCVWTTLARGSLKQPGLGLGLLPGGVCDGLAFYLEAPGRAKSLSEIWLREMWTDVYLPTWVDLELDGDLVSGLTFTVNQASRQFAGNLDIASQAALIGQAVGELGPCREYLELTIRKLAELGIDEPELRALQAEIALAI